MIRFLSLLLFVLFSWSGSTGSTYKQTSEPSAARFREASQFCKRNQLRTDLAFFVDMAVHSGRKRFFIVDLKHQRTIHASLCCHGMGKGSTESYPVFSNEKGSNCTSLGKYKTEGRAYSNWGIHIHYKMKGLEKSNNNAFARWVVLHSYDPVPETEIYPNHLPLGWSLGCPVVSNTTMTKIDSIMKKSNKPVLLWIYH